METPVERSEEITPPQDIIDVEIDDRWFDKINKNEKVVEIKKNSKTWINIEKGKLLRIIPKKYKGQTRKEFKVRVIQVNVYKGKDPLFAALISEGLDRVLPGVDTYTEAIEVYLKIGWTSEEIKELGIKAIIIQNSPWGV